MADWQTIKTEYITTDTSYRKLGKKHGVNYTTVCQRGKAEGWVKLRTQYKQETLAKTLDIASDRDADKLARLMNTTSKAIDVAVKAFEDEEQFNRYLVEKREKYLHPEVEEDENGEVTKIVQERQWTEEKTFKKVDTKALKDLTAVLKDLTGLMRDFYNIPTPAQAEAQRVAAERLELDKRKADASDDGVTGIEVTFSAGPEEWNE